MKKKRPTEDAATGHVSIHDILVSVGINIETLIEHLMYAEDQEPSEKVRQMLATLSAGNEMLAASCLEYEQLFKIAMVELPPYIATIRIRNPLYRADMEKPSDGADGLSHDLGDELPF
jgi:hypothetical protein